jgi:2-keto-4-pentenoate hydratase/2-oxohepta-3-ene-1,7-dioic acid hydratase in catechol pathway
VFLARVAGLDGMPRIMCSHNPADGWADLCQYVAGKVRGRGATSAAAHALADIMVGGSLTASLQYGDLFLELARGCADQGGVSTSPTRELTFLCPVDPPLLRDFMVFEEHFTFGYRWRDLPTPEVLYELPVSYLGNPATLVGDQAEIRWPYYAAEIDYELELGVVVGRECSDLAPEDATASILGVTLFNDFSARDMQRREMTGGLGPSKGKHFGSAAGPWIATLEELPDDLTLRAHVNGELRCETPAAEMIWSYAEILAWASAGEIIPAGSLLGTGTANGGSGIEFGRFLQHGDTVSLSADGLGCLSNTLGARGDGWHPTPRPRPTRETHHSVAP